MAKGLLSAEELGAFAGAAQDLEFIGGRFVRLFALSGVLRKVGSIAEAIDALERRRVELEAEAAELESEIAGKRRAAQREAADHLASAREETDEIRRKADQRRREVEAEVHDFLEAARSEERASKQRRDEHETAANEAAARQARELTEHRGNISAAVAELADKQAEIAAATAEHQRVLDAISELKARF